MRRITETLSKEIVAAAEGEIVGIVTNAYVDGKLRRVRGYKASSDERDAGRLLPLRRLLGEGEAMVIRESAALVETTLADCPIGLKLFDTTGAFRGVLRDLLFDEKTGEILSLVADDQEIAPGSVVCFGSNAIVLRAPAHAGILIRKRNGRRTGAKRPLPKPANVTFELHSESFDLPVEAERESFSGEYAFLLGRTVLKDILAERDLLAREGEHVTADLIAKAREKGKLVELTVNSRKG